MTTEIGCAHDPVGIKGEDALTIVTPTNPLPVVLASGSITLPPEVEIKNDTGNPVPVEVLNIADAISKHSRSADNEQAAPLLAGQTFTGASWVKVDEIANFQVLYAAQTPLAAVRILWSDDGVNQLAGVFGTTTLAVRSINNYNVAYHFSLNNNIGKYAKLQVVNGASDQTAFPGFISLWWNGKNPYNGSFGFLDAQLGNLSAALLTRSVQAGTRLDGTFGNVAIPEHDRDLHNEQVEPLVNGTPVNFTADDTADTILSVAHGLVAEKVVHFTTDGTLPAPLTTTSHYWVVNPTADDFQVSLTKNGTPVNLTDTGTGTHSYAVAGEFSGAYTRISDVDHFEILYASVTPMTVVEKVWSGDGINPLNRSVTDGVLNSTNTVTSATAKFTRYDRGSKILGTGIPANAIIIDVVNPTTVTLSVPATATATGVTLTLQSLLGSGAITALTLQGYNVYYDVNEGRNMAPFYKFHVINGASNQGLYPLFIDIKWLIKTPYHGTFGLLTAGLTQLSRALLTRAILAGTKPDGVSFANVGLTEQNDLRIGQQGVADAGNTFNTLLPAYLGVPYVPNVGGAPGALAADTVAGTWTPISNYAQFSISANFVGLGQGYAEWSNDAGATINHFETTAFGGGGGAFSNPSNGSSHYRIVFQNRTPAALTFKASTILRYLPVSQFLFPVTAPVNPTFPAALSKAVLAGQAPDANDDPSTTFTNLRVQGRHTFGSTSTPLPGDTGGTDHIFRGTWFAWQSSYVKLALDVAADVSGTVYVELSQQDTVVNGDDSSVTESIPFPYDPVTDPIFRQHIVVQSKWVRVKYINNLAAQSSFSLDVAFLVADPGVGMKSADQIIRQRSLVGMVDAIDSALSTEDNEFIHVKTSRNTNTNKDGKHAHITGIDVPVVLKTPVSGPQTRQFVLNQDAQRIDEPDVTGGTGFRYVEVRNAGTFHAFVKEDDTITEQNSNPIFLAGNAIYALAPGDELWGICEDTGGSTQSNNRFGSAGTTGALTSNDTRASQTGSGQVVYAEGYSFSFSPTFTDISRLRIGMEARKTPGQFETTTQTETRTGSTGGTPAGFVTTGAFASGVNTLLLCAVGRNTATGTVTSVVASDGTVFLPVDASLQNVTIGGHRVDLWYAFGNFGGGTVTATLSASTTALITCTRLSNVGLGTQIQAFGVTTGLGTAITGPALSGTNKGMSMLFIFHEASTCTAGSGYTNVSDQTLGTGSNQISLSSEYKPLVTTGSETGTGTISTSEDWAALGVTVYPRPSIDPTTTLSYTHNAIAGATSSLLTVTSESDATQYLDITADFTEILTTDIALIRAISTSETVGAANIETDALFLEVTETSGATTRVAVTQVGDQL